VRRVKTPAKSTFNRPLLGICLLAWWAARTGPWGAIIGGFSIVLMVLLFENQATKERKTRRLARLSQLSPQ
jgi:hypothetical protein